MPRLLSARRLRTLLLLLPLSFVVGCDSEDEGDGGSGFLDCDATATVSLDQTINGTLTASDCTLPAPDNRPADLYRLTLSGSTALTISMTSEDFDTYLQVYDADDDSEALFVNDDGGDGTDALLTETLAAGTYIIVANTFRVNEIGAYRITFSD